MSPFDDFFSFFKKGCFLASVHVICFVLLVLLITAYFVLDLSGVIFFVLLACLGFLWAGCFIFFMAGAMKSIKKSFDDF